MTLKISTSLIAGLSLIVFGAQAQCDFTFSNSTPCGGNSVSFNVVNPNGFYSWDFNSDGLADAYGSIAFYTYPLGYTNQDFPVILSSNGTVCDVDTVHVLGMPDPSIGIVPGTGTLDGNLIRICGGDSITTMSIFNASASFSTNVSYEIDWGDGTTEIFDNASFSNTNNLDHEYTGFGYFDINITVTSVSGCVSQESFLLYNGSNPSVGLANPGNTTGLCAPATITFPLSNTESNTAGTIYNIYISGELIQTYTQENVPSSFSHTFLTTSCGLNTLNELYENAYDVQIEATNPCGSSQAIIAPIEISSRPELEIEIDQPQFSCTDQEFTITNTSTGIAEIISGDPSTCETSLAPSWNISPGVPGIDWDLISGNLFNSESIDLSFYLPGTYTITMATSSSSCGSGSVSQILQILESPVAVGTAELNTAASPGLANECTPTEGTFTNLSTGDSITTQWAVSPFSGWEFLGGTNLDSDEMLIAFNEAGTYTVSLFAENQCSSNGWDTTFVIADIPEIYISPIPDQCEEVVLEFNSGNTSFNANGGTISSYSWQFPGASPEFSNEQFPNNIIYNSPGQYDVFLTIENQCGSSSLSESFSIQPEGVLVIDDDQIACKNDAPFQLNASPGGGQWMGLGVSSNGLLTPSELNIGEHTVYYSYQQGTCSLLDSLIVLVVPVPDVNPGAAQSACINEDPFLIIGGTPAGGTWASDNNGVIIGGDIFDAQNSGTGIYNLTYTYSNLNGCSNSSTKTIIIHGLPTVDAGPVQMVCENPIDVPLTGFSPSGGSWSGTGVTNDGIFNAGNTPGLGTYTLFYNYTDPNTGCSGQDSTLMTVIASVPVDAGADLEICIDEGTINLNQDVNLAGGVWTSNGSLGLFGNVFNPTEAGAGTHILTYTIGSGSCAESSGKTIIIHDLPQVEAGPDLSVCYRSDAIQLENYSPSNGSWSGIGITDSLLGLFYPGNLPQGNFTLTYSYSDPFGCLASDQMTITIMPLPLVTAPNDTIFCDAPFEVMLNSANPPGGLWTGEGIIDGNEGIIDPQSYGGPGNYSITYVYTDPQSGCANSDNLEIIIMEQSEVDAGPNDTICIDAGNYTFGSFNPAGGVWTGPGILDSLTGEIDPNLAGGGTHLYTYTYGQGSCLASDSKVIKIIDITNIDVGDEISICFTENPIQLSALNSPEGGIWQGSGIINQETGLFDPELADVGLHTLTYTFVDLTIGCTAILNKNVEVLPMQSPDFEVDEIICTNQTVVFNNLSNSQQSMRWDFGDGTTSTEYSPIHNYATTGTFEISLVAENYYSCMDTVLREVFVTQRPFPAFNLDSYESCGPFEINFTNQSSGFEVDFYWDFGNDSTSNEIIPPSQTYFAGRNDTTYYINLVVENLCGSVDFMDSIIVKAQPVANFGIRPETNCSPMEIAFANVSIGNAEEFYWDFGNGFTSNVMEPENQVFIANDSAITYNIFLVASNQCGIDTASNELVVAPPDVQAFFNTSVISGCQPLIVDFSNFATPGANIDWDFGDGNSSAELNPTHLFEETGEFKVIQYASSDCGYDTTSLLITVLPQPEVLFTHPTYVCLNEEINFENLSNNTSGHIWDFGDGDSTTLTNPSHYYTVPGIYTVNLTGISQINQCTDQYSSSVIVRDLPIANFDPSHINGCMPLIIDFENTSEGSTFYQWNFGDGNSSIEVNPNHSFDSVGTYEVSLISTDQNGCFNDTSLINIIVHPIPKSNFEFDRQSLCSLPAMVQFQNSSENAIGYSWNFDDGTFTDSNNPLHAFEEEGNYNISLVASNQFNCKDTSYAEIGIYPEPKAEFEISGAEGCSPVTISFENTSQNVDSYFWIFDDGSTSIENDVSHTFTHPGEYNVQLIAGIDGACFDTMSLEAPVVVHPTPFASFEAIQPDEFASGNYHFVNQSAYADEYFWEFSDGFTSTDESPTHRFMINGARTILLEAFTEEGCIDDTLVTFIPEFFGALHIPNGFSPEQGIGEVALFKPKGIGLKEYKIQVFSPYGLLLWESDELINGQPAEAWDGTYNGQLLPQDVYVWKAWGLFENGTQWIGESDGPGKYKKIGSVILLR